MLKLDYRNTNSQIIGKENGLEIEKEFENYKETIAKIITDLNKRKDKPGQWLQWMNLGYNEETVWYVKEYASLVKGRFENILVLGIGGSALGGIAVTEALMLGLPCFVTEYSSAHEQIIQGLDGFIFENSDRGTSYAIKYIMEHKNDIRNMKSAILAKDYSEMNALDTIVSIL